MKTFLLTVALIFICFFEQNCFAQDRGVIVIDLGQRLRKTKSLDSLSKSEIKIVRKSTNDSIVVISPVMGTSTCVFIMKDKKEIEDYEKRITHNCYAQSEINLTGLPDAKYELEFSSCYTGIRVYATITTTE